MVVLGAGGLAIQILDVLERLHAQPDLYFFDNISNNPDGAKLFNYPIIQNEDELLKNHKNNFIIGISQPANRERLYNHYKLNGVSFTNVIASTALVGKNSVEMEDANALLEQVIIESKVTIGKGNLFNTGTRIFHGSVIGNFCEFAPGATVLGNCIIGDAVFIGSNATILPKIKVGNGAVIGAGAVVTKDVLPNTLIKGVPGKASIIP